MLALLLIAFATDSTLPRHVTTSPGEVLRVVETGTGRPVVLLPGIFGAAYGFRRVVPLLNQAGYGTIVIEPLGVGGSARPANADYSLTAQADRLAAVLESLGVRGAIVVAHSVGASMALRLAYRHPELVSGVVSLDGGPAETAATPSLRRAMRFAPILKLLGGRGRVRRSIRDGLEAASGNPGWITEEVIHGYTAPAVDDLDATLAALSGMARSPEPETLADHLSEVRCHVTLLVGGAPHRSGVDSAQVALLAARLPAFRADTIAGAGHYIQEERPEAVLNAVRAFEASGSLLSRRAASPGRR